jgi:hypothetical protein
VLHQFDSMSTPAPSDSFGSSVLAMAKHDGHAERGAGVGYDRNGAWNRHRGCRYLAYGSTGGK